MTLLVAAIEGDGIWMVADTAITDPSGDLRARTNSPKIEIVCAGAIAGFSGDLFHGRRVVRALEGVETGLASVEFLLSEQRRYPSVAFAYGFMVGSIPHLYRIDGGKFAECTVLHIGDDDAFERFQSIRLRTDVDAAPNARHTLKVASYLPEGAPSGLSSAIDAFVRLFASTSERAVGGWPTPFQITKHGARLSPFSYNVSDPIADEIATGEVIPHGTASAGGFAFSLTELPNQTGMIAYWLQKPGGALISRTKDWYEETLLDGIPAEFRERAFAHLGVPVDLWFGGNAITNPEQVSIMLDAKGHPRQAIIKEGNRLESTMMEFEGEPFHVTARVEFAERPGISFPLSIALDDDGANATISWAQNSFKVQARDLECLIRQLGAVRRKMGQYQDIEPGSGARIDCPINPKWKAITKAHASIPGPAIHFLHPDFGWIGFVFPDDEAQSIGKWLLDDVARRKQTSDGQAPRKN